MSGPHTEAYIVPVHEMQMVAEARQDRDEIKRLRRALEHMAAWVAHWQADRACKLMPTAESLSESAEMIRNALNR